MKFLEAVKNSKLDLGGTHNVALNRLYLIFFKKALGFRIFLVSKTNGLKNFTHLNVSINQ